MVFDPTLAVRVEFTAGVWTDITEYVEGVQTDRGKARVEEDQRAGTGTLELNNADHRFTPNNSESPYYPNVKPMRRIEIRALGAGAWDSGLWDEGTWGDAHGVFFGYVEAWPMVYRSSTATTQVSIVDGFGPLNLARVSATYSQELSSARIAAVLDDADWPAGDRDIDTGQTTVQAATLELANPLAHLLKVADSENGLLFMDRDGNLRFRSRHGLIGGLLDADSFTFGDGAGEQLYESVVVEYDADDVWNEVSVSSQGVATQTASDAASIAEYKIVRTLEKTALLLTSTTEQADYAKFLLASYKDAAVRVDRIVFRLAEFWDRVLSCDLGSKIMVVANPEGSDPIVQPSYIEGIHWDIEGGSAWVCTWDVVPLTRRASFWVLGDSVQGILGSTTTLAY